MSDLCNDHLSSERRKSMRYIDVFFRADTIRVEEAMLVRKLFDSILSLHVL